MAMPAHSIDQAIERLGSVVARSRQIDSRIGYFAALYRNVTIRVKEGIAAGRFEDGPRMERFDVIFANRYLDAFEKFTQLKPTSRCWQAAFDGASRWRPLILQHLLLGMNAHINLDLGIAAARASPGDALPSLKRDFDEINALLSEMLNDVQRRIAKVSPWLGLLDRVGGRTDEFFINFSMARAREAAWRFAERLAPLRLPQQEDEIAEYDWFVQGLARRIARPRTLAAKLAALAIRLRESGDVKKVIDALNEPP